MKYCFTISLSILLIAPVCYGAAVMDSTLTTIIPSAAIVQAVSNSKNNCVINPENGSHTGLEAAFNVKTNGDDNTYDFVLSSSILTDAGVLAQYADSAVCVVKKDYARADSIMEGMEELADGHVHVIGGILNGV